MKTKHFWFNKIFPTHTPLYQIHITNHYHTLYQESVISTALCGQSDISDLWGSGQLKDNIWAGSAELLVCFKNFSQCNNIGFTQAFHSKEEFQEDAANWKWRSVLIWRRVLLWKDGGDYIGVCISTSQLPWFTQLLRLTSIKRWRLWGFSANDIRGDFEAREEQFLQPLQPKRGEEWRSVFQEQQVKTTSRWDRIWFHMVPPIPKCKRHRWFSLDFFQS